MARGVQLESGPQAEIRAPPLLDAGHERAAQLSVHPMVLRASVGASHLGQTHGCSPRWAGTGEPSRRQQRGCLPGQCLTRVFIQRERAAV